MNTGMTFRALIVSILAIAMALPAMAQSPALLTVSYAHYPPHIIADGDRPSGEYVDEMQKIVAQAGFDIKWVKVTVDEEAKLLDHGRRKFCVPGRYPSVERAKKWQFLPYLFDTIPQEIVVATPTAADRIQALGSLVPAMKDATMTGAVLESGLYGPEIDAVLETRPTWILRPGKTELQLLDVLIAGRADYTIVPEDQWFHARDHTPGASNLVPLYGMGTLPETPLMVVCSRAVDRDTVAALSAAMAALGFPHHDVPHD